MKNTVIAQIIQQMTPYLTDDQLRELKGTLYICLQPYDLRKCQTTVVVYQDNWTDYLRRFLMEKGALGLSNKTLDNYKLTLEMFLKSINKPIREYTDEDILCYLELYRRVRKVSFSRIKNMQRAAGDTWRITDSTTATSTTTMTADGMHIPDRAFSI